MWHTQRRWAIQSVATAEELIGALRQSQCMCQGFHFGNHLFLNDATSADGAQEYAVVEVAPDVVLTPGGTVSGVQVESWTCSWASPGGLGDCLRELSGPPVFQKPVMIGIHVAGTCGNCA